MSGNRRPALTASTRRASLRQLGAGSAWAVAASCLGVVASLASTTVLVRWMSPNAYGAFAIGVAVATLLTGIGGLGLAPAVARFGARLPSHDHGSGPYVVARSAVPIAVVVSGCAAIVTAGAAFVIGLYGNSPGAAQVIAIHIPLVALSPFVGVAGGYLTATFQSRLLSSIQSGSAVSQMTLSIAAALAGFVAASQIAAARVIAGVGGAFVLLGTFHRRRAVLTEGTAEATELPGTRALLSFGSAMTVTMMAGLMISQLDVFVLGIARGSEAAGRYAPISRVADIVILVPTTITTYLLPALSNAGRTNDLAHAGRLLHWASKWALAVAVPGVALLLIAPDTLIHMLFGGQIEGMDTPARLLAAGIATHFGFGFNGTALDAFGEARAVTVRSGYGAAASVALCAALIPRYGAVGAAISTLAGIATLNVLCSVLLHRKTGISVWDRAMTRVAIAGGLGMAISAVVITLAHSDGWAALLIAVLAGAPALAAAHASGNGLAKPASAAIPAGTRTLESNRAHELRGGAE